MNAKRLEHFQQRLLDERARILASLHEVDEALRLIYESPHDYGVCVQCRRPIPDERLELLPSARFCGRTADVTEASYSTIT